MLVEAEDVAEFVGGLVIVPLDLNFVDLLRSRNEFFLIIFIANLKLPIMNK